MNCKLIAFDLDGTLFQSHITSVNAINAALSDFNLPTQDDASILSLMGHQIHEVCVRLAPGLDEGGREKLGELITFYEKDFVAKEGKLFDGVEEMLMALQCQGYTLVICSNGKQEYIETVASVCDITRHFAAVRGKKIPLTKGERFKELLNEFAPSFAVFVGDRVHDFDAARENSVMSIGVTFGYGGDELERADYRASSPTEIVDLVRAIEEC